MLLLSLSVRIVCQRANKSLLDRALDVWGRKLPEENGLRVIHHEIFRLWVLRADELAAEGAYDGHVEALQNVRSGCRTRPFCRCLQLVLFENSGHGNGLASTVLELQIAPHHEQSERTHRRASHAWTSNTRVCNNQWWQGYMENKEEQR